MSRLLRILLASLLILVGVVGLFLPFLQGVLFIVAGMLILVEEIPSLAKHLVKLENRYPSVARGLRTMRGKDGSLHVKRFLLLLLVMTGLTALAVYGISSLRK